MVLLCLCGLLLLTAFWGLDPPWLNDGFVKLNENYKAGSWGQNVTLVFLVNIWAGADWDGQHRILKCSMYPQARQCPVHGTPLPRASPGMGASPLSWCWAAGGCLCHLSPGLILCRGAWWSVTPPWEPARTPLGFVQQCHELTHRATAPGLGIL